MVCEAEDEKADGESCPQRPVLEWQNGESERKKQEGLSCFLQDRQRRRDMSGDSVSVRGRLEPDSGGGEGVARSPIF